MTGLTRRAFQSLLGYLFDLEKIARHRKRGRPRSLSPDGYLGLLLFYFGSKMNYSHICLIFGITPSVCSCAIRSKSGLNRLDQFRQSPISWFLNPGLYSWVYNFSDFRSPGT